MSETPFSRAIVGVDLSLMDDYLLDYLAQFHSTLGIERVTFIYAIKQLDRQLQTLDYATVREVIAGELKNRIELFVTKYDLGKLQYEVEVHQDAPIDTLLRRAMELKVDLIVMGRKRSLNGSGIVSSHIARNSHCNILFVPQSPNPTLQQILVPVDFSEHAALALDVGFQMAVSSSVAVSAVNVYEVPTGYYKLGKSFDEFAAIMEKHARDDFRQFCKQHGIEKPPECQFLVKKTGSKVDIVFAHAQEKQSDLLIIGSRGRSGTAAILMGSFAEKMIFTENDIPVLIIKRDGENMGFLETLLSL